MAFYFKPHKKAIRNPPEVGITVNGGYRAALGARERKCNVFRIGWEVEGKYEEMQSHELELSREEAEGLASELRRYLNMELK